MHSEVIIPIRDDVVPLDDAKEKLKARSSRRSSYIALCMCTLSYEGEVLRGVYASKMISLTMCAALRQLSLPLDHEEVNEIRRLDCTNRQLSLSCDRYTKLPSYVCSRARRKGITSKQKFVVEIIFYGYIHWSENLERDTRRQ